MPERVKTEREYRSPRRDEQARRTRAAIVAAARAQFVSGGYASTTMQQIADDAGVSVQTVYATFGTKAALLQGALDIAIAGDDRPVPVNQRNWMETVFHDPDPVVRIRAYASAVRRILDGAAEMFAVVAAAAAADPALREMADENDQRRRRGATAVVDGLVAIGGLRPGLRRAAAVDVEQRRRVPAARAAIGLEPEAVRGLARHHADPATALRRRAGGRGWETGA